MTVLQVVTAEPLADHAPHGVTHKVELEVVPTWPDRSASNLDSRTS